MNKLINLLKQAVDNKGEVMNSTIEHEKDNGTSVIRDMGLDMRQRIEEDRVVRKNTVKIGMFSVDSSYEISLLGIIMLDKMIKRYGSSCLYICNKPFSILKRSYFGHEKSFMDDSDITRLSKLLFYMDETDFIKKRELVDSVNSMNFLYSYGVDRILGWREPFGMARLLTWIEESNAYNFIVFDIGDNLSKENIDILNNCDVIIRGNRIFSGGIENLNIDKSKVVDVIFNGNLEEGTGFFASDIDNVLVVREKGFEYSYEFGNDIDFLIKNITGKTGEGEIFAS
ncbi:hypothetical protein ACGCUQ_04540 [Eubacteriales bacterium KG127]